MIELLKVGAYIVSVVSGAIYVSEWYKKRKGRS